MYQQNDLLVIFGIQDQSLQETWNGNLVISSRGAWTIEAYFHLQLKEHKQLKIIYHFQLRESPPRESPPPHNIPIPTPASAHPLGDTHPSIYRLWMVSGSRLKAHGSLSLELWATSLEPWALSLEPWASTISHHGQIIDREFIWIVSIGGTSSN